MGSCCKTCFHCSGALPEAPLQIELDDRSVHVCSAECATTVKDIAGAGLGDYYQHRETPSDQNKPAQRPVEDWATFERPAVMQEFVRAAGDDELVADLLIQGVHCAACSWLIENTLSAIPGVNSIEVNAVTTRAELRWKPAQINLAELLRRIERLGFTPLPFTQRETQQATEQEKRLTLRRLLVAGLGMMQVVSYAIAMYAGAFQGMDPEIQKFFRLISLIVATPVVLYSGAPFFSGAWRNIHTRRMGMDVPVALAIGAAWSASVWNTFAGSGEVYFDSATMFVFFLSGTRYLEAAGRHKAFDLTHALAQHIPSTAVRLTAMGREEVGVMELQANDTVLVAQGMAFPADGELLDSDASVDESMLTGESVPVHRTAGDMLAAGTVNNGAAVRIRITKTGADTVIAQIARLVTQAGHDKPRLTQLTDKVAGIFVSIVLLIALLTGLVWAQLDAGRAFEIVLTVLVVTCPCALALATPAALTVATSALARSGFLIRKSDALHTLSQVTHFVFDKTGTLTDNSLEIDSTVVCEGLSEEQARLLAAILEANSAHPIARAFRTSKQLLPAENLRSIPGGGLEGLIDGQLFRIGTLEFATARMQRPCDQRLAFSNPERRNVYLANESALLARFEIVEHLRDDAQQTLQRMVQSDLQITIASGDQPAAVQALAARLGATDWNGGMLPEDKLTLVRDLQASNAVVAAVGDGINDAPVLAGADVSVAMGGGTSIAQHSADCIWLGNGLGGLQLAVETARRSMRIVKQNLTWALFYNLLAIPLAVTGMIAPWMAALGMSLSSVLVMLNALRLGAIGRVEQAGRPVATSQQQATSMELPA